MDKSSGAHSRQVGGSHYKDMPVEPLEVMRQVMTKDEYRGFLKGNIIKYSMRAGHKENAETDADKASHYMDFLKEFDNE